MRIKTWRKGTGLIVLAAFVMTFAMTACGGKVSAGSERESESITSLGTENVSSQPEVETETKQQADKEPQEGASGQIYLYGEQHSNELIIAKEFELWYNYYHNEGLRHLFIETPYYTAEFLNLYMKSDSSEMLDAVYDDWQGTMAQNPYLKAFYENIKRECPETVFHGTDVGHQYDTTGERYLDYLKENQLENSKQYQLAEEAIEQGKKWREYSDWDYREERMVENFVRELETLNGESVMGIYGGAHVGIDTADNNTESVPNMASQLYAIYGDVIHCEDLTWIKKDKEPERMDRITLAGKEYEAAYFGKEDITWSDEYLYREFWRLEHAYEVFKDRPKTGGVLPYINYPMKIETGQVFVLEYGMADGSVARFYARSDGNLWEGAATTEEFIPE